MRKTLVRSQVAGEGLLGGLLLDKPLRKREPAGEQKMESTSESRCAAIAEAQTL